MVDSSDLIARGSLAFRALPAGQPTAVTALAHVGALGAFGEHLVELRTPQTIAAVAGQAFVFDNRRLLRLGLRRLDEEPALSGAGRPIAGRGLPAMARGEEARGDFPGRRKGSIGSFHSHAVYCLYAVTLRRCGGISSPKLLRFSETD
jgi:hypothetical protein